MLIKPKWANICNIVLQHPNMPFEIQMKKESFRRPFSEKIYIYRTIDEWMLWWKKFVGNFLTFFYWAPLDFIYISEVSVWSDRLPAFFVCFSFRCDLRSCVIIFCNVIYSLEIDCRMINKKKSFLCS